MRTTVSHFTGFCTTEKWLVVYNILVLLVSFIVRWKLSQKGADRFFSWWCMACLDHHGEASFFMIDFVISLSPLLDFTRKCDINFTLIQSAWIQTKFYLYKPYHTRWKCLHLEYLPQFDSRKGVHRPINFGLHKHSSTWKIHIFESIAVFEI